VAGIVMIIEMSGNYSLLPPIIIVSVFTFLLSRKISFYKNQVDNRFKSPAHSYNMRTDVLDSTTLKDFFPEFRTIATANKDWTFTELRHHAANTHASDFVVIDNDWNYLGIISLRNVSVKKEDQENHIINYIEKTPNVNSNENLSKALNIILEHDVDKVAVIEQDKYVGYVRYRDIFEAYNTKAKQL
jgi:CIC family chloride channel protein